MSTRRNGKGKTEAVTPAAPAQADIKKAPDPFLDRIGSGYAERTFREQWTELEAMLRADVRRAHSSRCLGADGHERLLDAEKQVRNTAALMTFVFDRLGTVDFEFRRAASELLAGETAGPCEGYVEYGQRVLRDHWAQLRARVKADIEALRDSCVYGRMGSVPDGFMKCQDTMAEDIEEFVRQIDALMENFVWPEIEAADESLGYISDFLEGPDERSQESSPKKEQEPAAR
jgi:hypothetical protein